MQSLLSLLIGDIIIAVMCQEGKLSINQLSEVSLSRISENCSLGLQVNSRTPTSSTGSTGWTAELYKGRVIDVRPGRAAEILLHKETQGKTWWQTCGTTIESHRGGKMLLVNHSSALITCHRNPEWHENICRSNIWLPSTELWLK